MLSIRIVMLLNFLFFSLSSIAFGAPTFESGKYEGIYGTRTYKVYLPKNLLKNKKYPVVVMLHGCKQNAEEFAAGTRITEWADKEKFIVLLPEQNSEYNSYQCWNWILPANNTRVGETQVIIEMLDVVLAKYNGDSDKVFAAGMSAGASMVNILGNCYPERFKALGSHDGTQYFSTYNPLDFSNVVQHGPTVSADIAAQTGNACSFFAYNRPKSMPIIIFHGMNSPLMSPVHAFQIEAEFKILNDYFDNNVSDNSVILESTNENIPDTTTYGYNKYTLKNRDHQILIERYMINNLNHAWSGGLAGLPYNDPKGPDATNLIIKFFKHFGL